MNRVCFTTLSAVTLVLLSFAPPSSAAPQSAGISPADWPADAPLPRWRDGGPPPDDPGQKLVPYTVTWGGLQTAGMSGAPTSGVLASPPEYAPTQGVLFAYDQGWNSVVTDCVVGLTADPQYHEIAYVVVGSTSDVTKGTNQFTAAGADMSKVVFLVEPLDSIWLRDYGPHFIWQSGARAIADSHYYPNRPRDNFIPTLVARDLFEVPGYPMGLYYSGGNFQPGPNRSGFITSLIHEDNPGFSDDELLRLYHESQGIDTLHIMPRLPGSVDGTGHIDMWMYLVDDSNVIISKFKPGSNATAISITENAVAYFTNLGFTVHRTPAWNVGYTHYTYTNAFRVNDRVFTIKYGDGNPAYLADDRDAEIAWQAAAGPNVTLVPIDCYSIIPASGAIHCIVMQVPKYVDPAPSAHVVAPDGAELLGAGVPTELKWSAIDDADLATVDLRYSTDGGQSFPHVISTSEANDGSFVWSVPPTLTTQAVVQVVATDAASNQTMAMTETLVEITSSPRTVYDFSVGAGVDKWGWGYQTSNWNSVSGRRHPTQAATPLPSIAGGAYAALAASDATGGDSDSNRYISPKPSSSWESTHVFEFTIGESPDTIEDIEVVWEGYGDTCLQMELYVWDDVAHEWGDGRGWTGLNRYMANFSGNVDERLVGHIRSGFDRYVDATGKLTLLLYADRSSQESFHDYLSVTVTHTGGTKHPWADLGDGMPGLFGMPTLLGTGPLTAGQPVNLILESAYENTPAVLVVGLGQLGAPLYGGVFWPTPNVLLAWPTGSTGNVAVSALWPTGVPSATALTLQAWIPDPGGEQGWAATSGVVGTTP